MANEVRNELVNDDNPFSFQSFVERGNTSQAGSGAKRKAKKKKDKSQKTDFIDIFSDESSVSTTEVEKHEVGSGTSHPADNHGAKSGAANPFSFKNFMMTDTSGPSQVLSSGNEGDALEGENSILPEFHEEHFSKENELLSESDILDVNDVPLYTNFTDTSTHDVDVRRNSCNSDDSDDDNDDDNEGILQCANRNETVEDLPANFANLDHDPKTEIKRLKRENKELKKKLQEAQKSAIRESERVAKMLKEMKRVQEREAEDTKALEDMVHQVEQNLDLTTTRAVAAENMVSKLKQEMKSLKTQLTTTQIEKQQLEVERINIGAITQTAQGAAEKLATGALTAEQTIKHLLVGVDTLKLISGTLSSIATLTEVKEPPPPSQDHS
ncbi:uncharacterized protein LOC144437957 [Glandiceps talaboti]